MRPLTRLVEILGLRLIIRTTGTTVLSASLSEFSVMNPSLQPVILVVVSTRGLSFPKSWQQHSPLTTTVNTDRNGLPFIGK